MKRWPMRTCVVMSLALTGCVPSAVPLEIDTSAVQVDGATISVVVYADDDEGGCEALQFVATPALPVLFQATAPFDDIAVPRAGTKVLVVDAIVDDVSIARGCTAVGSEAVARTVALAPTLRLAAIDQTTIVITADDVRGAGATVVDVSGAPVANANVVVRVFDSHGDAVGDAIPLTADAAGRIEVAPTSAPAGPVRIDLVVERPSARAPTRLAGFAPPTLVPVVADVVLRPFSTTTGAAFAGVDATGVVVVDIVDGVAAPRRTVLPSPTARLAGLLDTSTRQWVVVDAGTPGLVSDIDSTVVSAAAPAIADDSEPVAFIAAGDCTQVALPGIISTASAQTLLTLVDDVLTATALPADVRVLTSVCALDDAGAAHRLLVLAGAAVSAIDVGPGLATPDELVGAVAITAGLERSIALVARHDGAALTIEPDGTEVVLRTLKLAGGAFVDNGDTQARVPSAPLLVAYGAFGGDDVLALLDGAFFGVGNGSGGPTAAGLASTVCSAGLCADAIAADIDNDDHVEVLVPQASGGAIVRFR